MVKAVGIQERRRPRIGILSAVFQKCPERAENKIIICMARCEETIRKLQIVPSEPRVKGL